MRWSFLCVRVIIVKMLICKRKEKKKKRKKKVSGTNDMAINVAQQKRSNNKCYALAFRYIQI